MANNINATLRSVHNRRRGNFWLILALASVVTLIFIVSASLPTSNPLSMFHSNSGSWIGAGQTNTVNEKAGPTTSPTPTCASSTVHFYTLDSGKEVPLAYGDGIVATPQDSLMQQFQTHLYTDPAFAASMEAMFGKIPLASMAMEEGSFENDRVLVQQCRADLPDGDFRDSVDGSCSSW